MPGWSGKPESRDVVFTLNHGFKGYSLRRHPGDPLFSYAMTMTQPSELLQLRQEIRQIIRQRRRALAPKQQIHFARQAAARVLAWPPLMVAHSVALFLSFDGELDTRPLIEQLWHKGKCVYLPVLSCSRPGCLLFQRYHPQSELVINRLKIREPKRDLRDTLPLSQLDVLIVPLVAFDRQGQRLGMGGGFYDRTLQNWRQYRLQPVGYAYDCQLVDTLPAKEWDIPLPTVVTPSKIWQW